jgi:hypothetical protein
MSDTTDPKSETRKERRAQKDLDRRMLAVDDPVEMKTEDGSEMLIPATAEEIAEDAAAFDEDVHGMRDTTPGGATRRRGNVHIRGVGEVS